ncbi:MAG: flippase-like domain-containing protein [Bryobacterales bacterium]|nr:flippase-like domain-containing protein [Bryobacterales bacterium]MBV9399132.1 flippase-like domain-containing protein [Bryobacterales bacterium]
MKKRHAGVALALAALAATAFVIYRWRTYGFNWRQFIGTMSGADPGWMAVSLVLILTTYVGRALRWEVMLRPLTQKARLLPILSATCIGFAAVVLFGRAGEPVRPFLISRRSQVPFSSQVASWVVERILDLLMILVIFGIALTQVHQSSIPPSPRLQTFLRAAGGMAGIIGLISLALLLGLRQFHGRVQARLLDALSFLPERTTTRIRTFLQAFAQGMQSTRRKSFAAELLVYTAAEWAIIAASFYCLLRATPATSHLDFTDAIIVLGFVSLGSVVQIPGVGGGIQIVTVLVLTEFYGLGLEEASGVALLWWVVGFMTIIPVGLILAFHEGIKWRNLKNIGPMDSSDMGTPDIHAQT